MPDDIQSKYADRHPLLVAAASTLQTEIEEILTDAEIDHVAEFTAMTPAKFQSAAGEFNDPLLEMPDQIAGTIAVREVQILKTVSSKINECLTVLNEQWKTAERDPAPVLECRCLLPRHVLPVGWTSYASMPTLFVAQIVADPNVATQTMADTIPLNADGPHALVMKGGGIKGLAYVGALEQLDDHYEFNWFIGTSAGAITAILLGAGYTYNELLEKLRTKDFRDFFDAKWYQMPFNLIRDKGLHHAKSFTDWMDELLARKLKSQRRVRLSDLPNRVTVYASKRGIGALKFDSIDSDQDAAYAARCSMSIPWLFVPQSNQGLRTYDGGIQHNYPVDRLLEDYPGTKFISLYLGAEIYEPIKSTSVFADLISIISEASDHDAIEKYRDSTVIIDPRPIGTLDFALSEDEKNLLLLTGRVGAMSHLSPESPEVEQAKADRDTLKATVEAARASVSRRRRIIRWVILVACIAITGFATWWWFFKGPPPLGMSFEELLEKIEREGGDNTLEYERNKIVRWTMVLVEAIPDSHYRVQSQRLDEMRTGGKRYWDSDAFFNIAPDGNYTYDLEKDRVYTFTGSISNIRSRDEGWRILLRSSRFEREP